MLNVLREFHRKLGIKYRLDRWRLYAKRFGLRRAIAISHRLSSQRMIFEESVPGLANPVAVRGGTADASTFEKIFVWNEYDLDHPAGVKTIIDAGANIGLSAIFFANRFPGARIIALEPQRDNFELLRRNVSPYSQIVPLNAALWNEDTTLGLLNPDDRVDSYCFGSAATEQSVPAFTIPSLLARFGLDRVDVLKIDIEGAEADVFAERPGWVDRVRMFIVELHGDNARANFVEATSGLNAVRYRRGENEIVVLRSL